MNPWFGQHSSYESRLWQLRAVFSGIYSQATPHTPPHPKIAKFLTHIGAGG